LGVDISGTKIAVGLVDLASGRLVHHLLSPTPQTRDAGVMPTAIRETTAKVRDLGLRDRASAVGLGLGLPELVHPDDSLASNWIADWNGRSLAIDLTGFGPVRVDSGVRLAALAELRYGHGRDLPTFAFINIGSGLSYAFCQDGRIHRGAHGCAIHFASSDLVTFDVACGACDPFNLESHASGFSLARVYAVRTGRVATARDIVEGRCGLTGEALLDQATTALASYLGQMVNMLDPHDAVLSGELGTAPGFFGRMRAKLPPYIWAEGCREVPVLASALGATAGVVGAAALHLGHG